MERGVSEVEYSPWRIKTLSIQYPFFNEDIGVQTINGFKIFAPTTKNYVLALCKECGNSWETSIYTLSCIQSCGCKKISQLKRLPEYINGFRTIKCHGYDKERGVRWATVECKECKRIYECDPNKLQYRKHCGCRKKGIIACKYAKSHPQLAQAIKHMMGRCYNKNNQDYYNYGARGITVCDEWLKDRNTFCEWSLKNGFENDKGLSIDRIDSNKGYGPENCKWSTAIQQSRNTRRNVLNMELALSLRKDSELMENHELAEKYKVSLATVYAVKANMVWREDAD